MPKQTKFQIALADAETKLIRAKTDLTNFQRKASDLTHRIPKLQAAVDSLRALEIGTKGSKPATKAQELPPDVHQVQVTNCGHAVGETCNICSPRQPLALKGVLRGRQNVDLGTDAEWEGTGTKQ